MPEKFKVVISGMSGRFPECNDVDTFKEKLLRNDEFITVDDRKWPVGFKHERLGEKLIPDATGKYVDFVVFDQTIFKLTKTFALSTDITNRKILEPAFEAVVDAGINPYSLDGRNVSVFMAAGINEIDHNCYGNNMPSNNLFLIGANKSMLSNRVSYALNLKGPSHTCHIDPHGGLESLEIAYRYVSEGFVEAAIVGVATSIADARISLHYHSYGMLCPDGVTRPFDELANGYARSESVVCFYVQRAEDAKRSYGEVVFCDLRYLGNEIPLFINYGEKYVTTCMEQLLEANDFSNIAFLEMNACGHKMLDKIESNVVAKLLTKDRSEPLLVGSIKSNIGHVEAAAGLMGVLKALLALDSGTVIPNQNFQTPNAEIEAFKTNQLKVVTEKLALPGNTVAVNSLSLFGTVGLAILKQNDKKLIPQAGTQDEPFPRLLLICGRQEADVKTKLTKIENSPFNAEFIALANNVFQQFMPQHTYRGFTILPTPLKPVNNVKERGDPNRPIWFIFSGMGSQWMGMGKSLLKLPLFAETVAKCDLVLRKKDIDIYHILTSDDPTLFDDIVNAFVGIITVQIGLYEVIKALGITADGIIGHSVGENACAYADGCLSLEQAVLASWARGVASNEVKTIKGMMAAVGKGYAEIKDTLPEDIQVACHNSADSCTLTGPAESVESYVQELKGKGVFARAVNVANIAYHSKYIANVGPRLRQRLKQVIKEPKQRSPKWISTSVPESSWDTSLAQCCSAEYLTNNLLSPVLFEEGCKHIPENAICIEFAPHGLLQAILKRSLPESCTNIPLTNRGKVNDNLSYLLSSIGTLYIAGPNPEVNNIFPAVEYPVSRGTPHISPLCTWYHQDDGIPYLIRAHPEEDLTMANELIPVCVRGDSDHAYLQDHRFGDTIMIPQSFFMFLTWKMFLSESPQDKVASSMVVLEDVRMHHNLIFPSALDVKYASIMIQYGSGSFQTILQDVENSDDIQIVMTGRIYLMPENKSDQNPTCTKPSDSFIGKKQFYNILEHCGYKLGEEFALVKEIQRHKRKYSGKIIWNGNWVTFLDALMKVQMFADNNENIESVVPTYVQRLEIPIFKYQSFEKGTVVPYGLDATTKELFCPGLVIHTLKYKTLPKPEVKLSPFRFVPYPNPRCQDVIEFLHLCLQIAVENLVTFDFDTSSKYLTVFDTTGKYEQVIEQITQTQVSLQSIVMLDAQKKRKASGFAHVLIITDNVEKLSEIYTAAKNLFVLVISPPTSLSDQKYGEQHFTKLVQQLFSVKKFTLLKKKEQDSINDWAIRSPRKIDGHVPSSLLISQNFEVEDLLRLLKLKADHSDERCLYIMDEGVSKQKLAESVQKQAELGLRVSVLKQGELGSYRNLIQKSDPACNNKTTLKQAQLLSKISASPKRLNYVYFDDIENISVGQIFGFAYVTTLDKKVREMGLATSSTSGNAQYDPYLQWKVPNNYSSEEAATMLYIYAQVYRLLVLIPSLRSDYLQTVMINVGTDYLLAEAFIVLSLYKNLEIFVTVDSDEDALLFENRFPEIPHDHILRSENVSYVKLKQKMNGKGIDLLVNCLCGIEHVETSLKCLGVFGIYVEVGTKNCLESNDMGLYPFLLLISFHPMRKRISDLLKLPVEKKQMMQKFIGNCLEKGVIAPLKFRTESIKPISVQGNRLLEQIQNRSASIIKYDRNHSYLILATSLEDSSLLELIEWLIGQGACKFMVALEKFAMPSQTENRMNRVLKLPNVNILFTSAAKFDDRREAGSLLNQMEKLGPLEATFYLSIKTAGNRISNLNDLVSPDVYFVGLCSAGLKEFEKRCANGSPAILLYSDKPKIIMRALPQLNELLAQNDNNNAEILYHVTISECSNDLGSKATNHPGLRDYLPNSVEMLSAIGEDETIEPTFVEMGSLSGKYLHCKGVFPIFALPALHSLILKPLFKQLSYPIFSATVTSTASVKELAYKLYSSLVNIQPTGPITMISETWTLPLALELRSYAQRDGRRYRMFVLEGIPRIWSDRFKRLLSAGAENFDAVCADEIFHFVKKPKKSFCSKFVSFEHNVRILAESASRDLKIVENVVRAAKKIKRAIEELSGIQLTNELLEHVIWFEKSRPNDQTLKLSVTSDVVVLNEPTYRDLLCNPEVGKTINENAEFSWWEYTKP